MLRRFPLIVTLAASLAGCGHDGGNTNYTRQVTDPVIAPWKLSCDPSTAKPATPLRRLTSREYMHALADVLPWLDTGYTPLTFEGAGRPAVSGFENDATKQEVSRPLVADLAGAASEFGRLAAEQVAGAGCALDRACLRGTLLDAARLLWRHPLDADETASLGELFDSVADASGVETAVGALVEALLASPDFLYRVETAENAAAPDTTRVPASGLELATRLSFLLWASVPDDALLRAAAKGDLATADGLAREAARMMDDPRFFRGLGAFHQQWLSARQRTAINAYPEQPHLGRSLDREFEHFFEALWPEDPTLADVLTTDRVSVDGELAKVYGVPAPSDGWTAAQLTTPERRGILGLAAFLAARTDNWEGSPIKRGHTVRSDLLCGSLAAPPANLMGTVRKPDDLPVPNRQRYDEATRRDPCWSCHAAMNEPGYAFEHFDAKGGWLSLDHGQPIDATGKLAGSDVDGPFDGEAELSDRLSRSAQVRDCYASHWMRFALGRGDDGCETVPVAARFAASGGSLRELVLAVATSDAFRFKRAEAP